MVTKDEVKKMIEESGKKIIDSINKSIKESMKETNNKMDLLLEKLENLNNRVESLETENIQLNEKYNKLVEENIEFKTKIGDLEESLTFTQDELLEKKIDNVYADMNRDFHYVWEDYQHLKEKCRIQEDRMRRNNLRIDGLKQNQNESWTDTEEKVKTLFKETLGIEKEIVIERAHRVQGKRQQANQTIVLKLLNYKHKELILSSTKKLSKTGIYINEDFSEETRDLRNNLRKQMKKEREKGKFCILKYDKLIIREFRDRNKQYQHNTDGKKTEETHKE